MTSTPFPMGFKRPRRGFSSGDFLNQYLQGFTGSQTPAASAPAETASAPQAEAGTQQNLAPGDIGFGLTPEGKTILDSNGSYGGFMPKIEKRDGKYYVEDNRGYGPFKGKMHEVSESMAANRARIASMGMMRYLMPHPNPEQFGATIEAGGITGSMTPSYVTGGGTVWNPQFKFSGALTPSNYNQWAMAYQTSRNPNFDPLSKAGSETVTSNYDISANPALALRKGMPINIQATAEEIARRRGTAVDQSAIDRAEWIAGNQLYRKNVEGGYAQPGTYARQGGGAARLRGR